MVVASLCHDIGKYVSVPNHPRIAAEILRPYVRDEVFHVILTHQDFQGRHYYHHFGGDPDARERTAASRGSALGERFADEWDQTSFDPDYPTKPLVALRAPRARGVRPTAQPLMGSTPHRAAVPRADPVAPPSACAGARGRGRPLRAPPRAGGSSPCSGGRPGGVLFGLPALSRGHVAGRATTSSRTSPCGCWWGSTFATGTPRCGTPTCGADRPCCRAFNAGAAYPATWLFACCPGPSPGSSTRPWWRWWRPLGMVVLLRVLGRSWTASGLGAWPSPTAGSWRPRACTSTWWRRVPGCRGPSPASTGWPIAPGPLGRARGWRCWARPSGSWGCRGRRSPSSTAGSCSALYALWLLWRHATGRRWSFVARWRLGSARPGRWPAPSSCPGALVQEQSQRACTTTGSSRRGR